MATKSPSSIRTFIAHFVGTPGFVLWLLAWLMVIGGVLYLILVNTASWGPQPVQETPPADAQPLTLLQLLVLVFMAGIAWYIIASFTRKAIKRISSYFMEPARVELYMVFGGFILGWAIVTIAAVVWIFAPYVWWSALIAVVIGLVSLGAEYLLLKDYR